VVPSGISKKVYDLVSSTLRTPDLDGFYRLFLIPGMLSVAWHAAHLLNKETQEWDIACWDRVIGALAKAPVLGL
jgi:hypothetical protein